MKNDIQSILLSEEQISKRVHELGIQLSNDYRDKNPLLISVLRGSFIFMADLVRAMDIPCTLDFLAVSSYGKKSVTSGTVKITKDLELDISGRHVIVVEDILDSGMTLSFLMNLLKAKKIESVRICTLLDKPERRQVPITADYTGFKIPDLFVVGYGLDYADMYRNLPYIGILKPEIYSE